MATTPEARIRVPAARRRVPFALGRKVLAEVVVQTTTARAISRALIFMFTLRRWICGVRRARDLRLSTHFYSVVGGKGKTKSVYGELLLFPQCSRPAAEWVAGLWVNEEIEQVAAAESGRRVYYGTMAGLIERRWHRVQCTGVGRARMRWFERRYRSGWCVPVLDCMKNVSTY